MAVANYTNYKLYSKTQRTLTDYNHDAIDKIPHYKKQIGYDGELKDYLDFQDNIPNLNRYLIKRNSFTGLSTWEETLQNGADFIFKIGRKFFKIEVSTLGKEYGYKRSWLPSRFKRLFNKEYETKPKGCKKNPFKIVRIWLVNNADLMKNLIEMRQICEGFGVMLLTISDVITLLLSTIASTTSRPINTLNTTAYIPNGEIDNKTVDIIQDNNKKSEIADLDFDKEIDKAKKLGLYNDYGFSS